MACIASGMMFFAGIGSGPVFIYSSSGCDGSEFSISECDLDMYSSSRSSSSCNHFDDTTLMCTGIRVVQVWMCEMKIFFVMCSTMHPWRC